MGCQVITPTVAQVATVLFDPWVYDRITDDNCPPMDEFEIPEADYILGTVDGQPASLFVTHDCKMHYMTRPCYLMAARELFRLSMNRYGDWCYCEIPTLYQTTINFAIKEGFRVVGTVGQHLKGGKLYPITRLECR